MITEVFFDVETKKLFSDITTNDPGDLGVSVVSVFRRELTDDLHITVRGEMKSFWDKENAYGPYIAEMWDWFKGADRIIGFNSLKFDVPALAPYTDFNFARLKHFDMLDEVRKVLGHRIGLDALAHDTLGAGKTDVGTNAVVYWAKRDEESLTKLRTYCEADVAITRDLYDFAVRNKYLKFTDKWNNPQKFDVDFSYPAKANANSPQIGLF